MEAVSSSLLAHRIATPASPRRRSDTCTAIRARLHRGIKAARSKKDGTSSDAQDGTGDTMALSGSPCPCLQTRTREASLNQRDDPDAWSRDLSCVVGFVFGSEGAPDNSASTLPSPGLVCLKLHRASCERFQHHSERKRRERKRDSSEKLCVRRRTDRLLPCHPPSPPPPSSFVSLPPLAHLLSLPALLSRATPPPLDTQSRTTKTTSSKRSSRGTFPHTRYALKQLRTTWGTASSVHRGAKFRVWGSG
jgi:hypothetical protein